MTAGKPVWTSSTFLLYAGGLTVLGAALAALGYLSSSYGRGAMAGWSLLILVVLIAIAHGFRRRERPIAAGIFAFASVVAWGAFVGVCWRWFGWLGPHSRFEDFSFARLSLEVLVLAAAVAMRHRFGFPMITLVSAVVGWLFLVDLITSGGTGTAVLTLIVGIAYLLAGSASDELSAFWLHLVGGALGAGSLVYWWHTSDTQWALLSVGSLVYVAIAYVTRRSSWAVLGTLGFFAATVHFVVGTPRELLSAGIAGWSPSVAFACLGFWIVLLGLLGRRRRAAA